MKKASTFTKITTYYLALNILFALGGFCFSMFTPLPAQAMNVQPMIDATAECQQTSMQSPVQKIETSLPTSNNPMPCCVSQTNQPNSATPLQKTELQKQVTSSIIVLIQAPAILENHASYRAYYYSPPPNKLSLDTIVIRV